MSIPGSLQILLCVCFPQLKQAQIRVITLFIANCRFIEAGVLFCFFQTKPKLQPLAFSVSNKKFLLSGRKCSDEQFHFKRKYELWQLSQIEMS